LAQAADPLDYTRDIKPILVKRCYACHGPDEGKRKGDLRLDVRKEAVAEAIVPGKSAESEMIARITSDDPDERMPPPKSKRPRPTDAEIKLLRRWIDEGAKYDEHWAWVKPKRPAVPKTTGTWGRNTLDAFVAAGTRRTILRTRPRPIAARSFAGCRWT